jgi:hypothetical protein
MNIARYFILVPLVFCMPAAASQSDIDNDGLNDLFEQRLLERFAPTWLLSEKECDSLPAEFRSGERSPQLLARNGTIYGQVFPIDLPGRAGVFIEVHYYHLWNRDCSLNGHDLDAEHVSALLSAGKPADSASAWKAEYWYAAAHEDTACDSSHAIRSSSIHAELRGPTVWISAGKHASFLDGSLCRGGCGCDNCSDMKPVEISRLVNLGEPGAPMNDILWTQWPGWPLAAKMGTDFPEPVLAKLDAAEPTAMTPVNESHAPVKTTILVGGSTTEAVLSANKKTGTAFSSTSGAVRTSLDKSRKGTGNFLIRAARGVRKALGGGGVNPNEE